MANAMRVGGPYGDMKTAVSIRNEAASINHLPKSLFYIKKTSDGYTVYRRFGGARYG